MVSQMVSDIKSKAKVLNAENKAYFISRHIKAWKDITSDQWVNGTITGAKIEIEDLTKVTIGWSAHQKNLSGIEKTFFRKEIKRLREQGVTLARPWLHIFNIFKRKYFYRHKPVLSALWKKDRQAMNYFLQIFSLLGILLDYTNVYVSRQPIY